MINFRRFLVFIFVLCFFSLQSNASGLKNKAFRTIWHPTYLGERLDYCSFDGKECGKEVANRYCQMLGYDYSSQNVIAYNVGLTNYLASRAQCKGWRCNGFMTISCSIGLSHNPPKPYHYREKQFVYPRYNDYRVDWCYDKNKGCGARAANSFCSRMGFLQAKRFVKEAQISATKSIGSQELCFGHQCNAFKSILCYR
ncbi:hypothetical protein [Legionella bononiensis]|uniref:Uncharacterized protein n=1 Tax=Legionella bononiensis TaxID=2793102 RepID=A0ABS1W865_9GAMM|nr:hypothetical protein [Legionella bononiensis]MBL7479929.1 hypothetical protein [Legionella bononiensis]MBL7525556.1 hypothetical protein [Legionella bononiensis]MBL7561740.1 hypothetical protein [Legionella bononiensis]